MLRKLPLFPLGTILFPGATINLHIFEDRYRQMIGECLETHSPFGVVLIREGHEVEENRREAHPAEPYHIGTVAMINASVRLDDGRLLITAVGRQRFRIEQIVQYRPYLLASVNELPEESLPLEATDELRTTYARYWQAVAAATGNEVQPEELPDDPVAMLYQLADRLQVPMARKQHWLEVNHHTRMRELTGDLRAELALMPSGRRRTGDGLLGSSSLN